MTVQKFRSLKKFRCRYKVAIGSAGPSITEWELGDRLERYYRELDEGVDPGLYYIEPGNDALIPSPLIKECPTEADFQALLDRILRQPHIGRLVGAGADLNRLVNRIMSDAVAGHSKKWLWPTQDELTAKLRLMHRRAQSAEKAISDKYVQELNLRWSLGHAEERWEHTSKKLEAEAMVSFHAKEVHAHHIEMMQTVVRTQKAQYWVQVLQQEAKPLFIKKPAVNAEPTYQPVANRIEFGTFREAFDYLHGTDDVYMFSTCDLDGNYERYTSLNDLDNARLMDRVNEEGIHLETLADLRLYSK